MNIFNGPLYRYGGHIKLIRFNEYYGIPRGHEHDPVSRLELVFYGLSLLNDFSGKRRSLLHPNTAQRSSPSSRNLAPVDAFR